MQMVRFLLAFVLLPTLALSQTAEQTAPARAVISGIVTDASTGQPLKKASIMFRNSQSSGGRFQQPLVVTTGSDGRFAMALEPGEYRLNANRNGYVRQAYGAKDPRQPGSPLTLAAGQDLKDINFRLVPGGVITGRVIDEDGEPMSGVMVQVLRATYQNNERVLQSNGGGGSRTDDRGEFRIFGLAPRRYYLSATKRGMMDFMVMGGSGEDRTMEFLPGMAQQSEGYPTTYYPGTTDSGSAAAIEVRAGEEQRINFSLAPSRAFRVSGLVIDSSGRPLKQGFATVVSRAGGFGPPSGFGQVHDGKLDIRGVTSGAYTLIVGTRDDETEAARRDIDVGDQDINDLHINLSRGSEIHGSVRFVDFSGKPPDSMNIMLLPKRSGGFFGMASGTAKADGSFTLSDVFPEDYVTSVTNLPSGTYLKSVRVGSDETVTSGFNGAKATTMEIVISGRAATIEGNVTDRDGKPAAGATVVLLSDKPVKASRRGGGPQTANTDQNGHFIFRGLRPANYSVSAWEDIDDEDYLDPDFEQRQGSRMTSIKISEGDEHVENLKLINSEQRLAER